MSSSIIDVHTHVFPDALAPRAMALLAAQGNVVPCFDGTLAGLHQSMLHSGVHQSIAQPIATKPSQVRAINDWAIQSNSRDVLFFGTIHPDFDGIPDELARIHAAGIRGIKIHGDYQDLFVDDEQRAFPIYEALEQLGMILLFHAGVDIGIPPPVHASPDRIARVHAAFPRLLIIAAHLGGFKQWDLVEQHLVGHSVYLDTSYVMGYASDAYVAQLLEAHGYERILFASDGPWMDQGAQIAWIARLCIPQEARRLIFYENAARLLS